MDHKQQDRKYERPIRPILDKINKQLGTKIDFDPLIGPPRQEQETDNPDVYIFHHLCDSRTPSRVLELYVAKQQYHFIEVEPQPSKVEPQSLSATATSSIEAELQAFWRHGNSDPKRVVYIPPQVPAKF